MHALKETGPERFEPFRSQVNEAQPADHMLFQADQAQV